MEPEGREGWRGREERVAARFDEHGHILLCVLPGAGGDVGYRGEGYGAAVFPKLYGWRGYVERRRVIHVGNFDCNHAQMAGNGA